VAAPPEDSQFQVEPAEQTVASDVAVDATATPPVGEPAPAQHPVRMAFFFFAGALALCLFGYLALSTPASWFPSAAPKSWSASDLALVRGTGDLVADDLVLTATDGTGSAVISINSDFQSTEYPVVAWTAFDLPDNLEVRLLWRTDYASSKVNAVQLSVASGRILPVSLANNQGWLGRIKGLALLVSGPLHQPVRIRGVAIKPAGALELLTDRAREWLTFEGWSGTSINTVTGGADLQDLPLPTLLAVAIVLAAAVCFGLARRHRIAMVLPAVIGAVFVIGWLVLDARWVQNLGRQVTKTAEQYQGKDWRERRLAAEDGPLFAFIEKVRAKLPSTPARVFMVADTNYFRDRGAYHLYPHNVYFDPWQNTMPIPSLMHAGDYLVVYDRSGIQYDSTQKRLRWDANAPIAAEALLIEPGAALFRLL
jgi:hypothetical protein